jgi:hypothetical protein
MFIGRWLLRNSRAGGPSSRKTILCRSTVRQRIEDRLAVAALTAFMTAFYMWRLNVHDLLWRIAR